MVCRARRGGGDERRGTRLRNNDGEKKVNMILKELEEGGSIRGVACTLMGVIGPKCL